MSKFFLIIIIILLIGEIYFSWKNFTLHKSGQKILSDERYYELKYHINLLKSISAILIFVISFLGFSSYKDLKGNLFTETEKEIDKQNKYIFLLESRLDSIALSVDTLNKIKSRINTEINIQNLKLNKPSYR